MKYLLFLCCCIALLASDGGLLQTISSAGIATNATEYRTFQPSKIRKQKRKLKQRVTAWGWAVLALTGLLIGGMVWLAVWLWPMAAIGWRVFIALFGVSLAIVTAFVGLFIFSYSYPTDRDVRFEARQRLGRLSEKLAIAPESDWCFPDDEYRISIGADSARLLVVDYQRDMGWLIPKGNIADIRSDFVAAEAAQATYPSHAGMAAIIAQKPQKIRTRPPYPASLLEKPMQVIQFDLQDIPLQSLTIVYRGKIYADSAQNIKSELRTLWKQ